MAGSAAEDFDLKVGETAWLHSTETKGFLGRHDIQAISEDGNTITLNDVAYTYDIETNHWTNQTTNETIWMTFSSVAEALRTGFWLRENAEGLEVPPGMNQPDAMAPEFAALRVGGNGPALPPALAQFLGQVPAPMETAEELFGFSVGEAVVVQNADGSFHAKGPVEAISLDGNTVTVKGADYIYSPASGEWNFSGGAAILSFGMSYAEAVEEGLLE